MQMKHTYLMRHQGTEHIYISSYNHPITIDDDHTHFCGATVVSPHTKQEMLYCLLYRGYKRDYRLVWVNQYGNFYDNPRHPEVQD